MSRTINPSSGLPLYLQVARLVQEEIASGELQPDDDAPSLRAMASRLRLNVHTVAKAYQLLDREGVLVRRRGEPYRVAAGASPARALLRDDIDLLLARAGSLGLTDQDVRQLLDDAVAARSVRSA